MLDRPFTLLLVVIALLVLGGQFGYAGSYRSDSYLLVLGMIIGYLVMKFI